MIPGKSAVLAVILSMLCLSPVLAAVPYANTDDDRKAKQALPPAGKALVYIYRPADAGPAKSPAVLFNNRKHGQLAPLTYYMWTVEPGRVDLRTDEAGSRTLSLRTQGGRIYFVRLTVGRDGRGELRQVSYGAGRQDVHRARLLREVAAADDDSDAGSSGRGGFTLIVKGGSYQLGSDSQTILGLQRNFGTTGSAFGAEGEWRLANGLAFGAEVFSHSHDYTTSGAVGTGDMSALHIMFNVKKYFRPASLVQPYIGGGVGAVTAEFSSGSGASAITGSGGGYALQAMGGVAFRWQHVGLYTELKLQKAEAEDANGETVDVSGSALFVGMSLSF